MGLIVPGLFVPEYNPATLTAPNAKLGELVDGVHPILWQKDKPKYPLAKFALIQAHNETPANDPYNVWIHRRLAKLYRLEGQFDDCEFHLKKAQDLSHDQLGLSHPQTLRALVKRMDLEKLKFLIAQSRVRQLFPGKLERIGLELYREPFDAATSANQNWCASLLHADLYTNLGEWEKARDLYHTAAEAAPDEATRARINTMHACCHLHVAPNTVPTNGEGK